MTVEHRLQQLESSSRFMKGVLTLGTLIAVAVITAGATSVASKVLDVQKLILRDEAGNERGQLFATEKAWGLILLNRDGTKAVSVVSTKEVNGFLLSDPNGNVRQSLTSNLGETYWSILRPGSDQPQFEVMDKVQGTVVAIRDRANMQRVELGVSEKGSAIALSDHNGTMRTVLSEGQEGIATFGEDGSPQWSPAWERLSPAERERLKGLLPKSLAPKP